MDLDPAWIRIRIDQTLWIRIRIRIQSIRIHITAFLQLRKKDVQRSHNILIIKDFIFTKTDDRWMG